jgi:hypothetical protein
MLEAGQCVTWSEATNRPLRIQTDPDSGYIKTVSKVKTCAAGPNGPYMVRTSLVCNMSSRAPLIYKFKIIAETKLKSEGSESWDKYDRVFKADAALIQELQGRLSLKGEAAR